MHFIQIATGQSVLPLKPKSAIPYNEYSGANTFSTLKYIEYKIVHHVKMLCPSYLHWQFHRINVYMSDGKNGIEA